MDAQMHDYSWYYSKILRGFDNYERNTRDPHPNAVNRKRAVGKESLKDDSEQLWQGALLKLWYPLCFKRYYYRSYLGGDTRGEWSVSETASMF
jgi:hypothetical protein